MYPICCGIVGQCTRAPRVRNGSRLCEKSREPRKRRIVFSIAVSRPRLPAQLVSVSMKLRQMFYTQIERRRFHTAWVKNGSVRCAYRKSNPDIFVMQSAEDRAAKNTPCPLYGAR